jgi:vitamin B12 transporter
MRSLLFATVALAAVLPVSARAQQTQPVSELVVTATRLPSAIDLITGARVIGRAELEARQTPFLEDVLATIPGVTITQQGAFGGLASIRIRGAGPDKTLVLVDGVPVGDPADPNGAFDPSSLQTADVERIEVLSGPQGALWGSEAVGGVISITTRAIDGVRAEAEGGSLGTARGFLGAGVSRDAFSVSGSVAGFSTDGISKAASGTERDPFRTLTGDLAGRVRVASWLELDAKLHSTYSDVHIDGFPFPDFILADTPDKNLTHAWSGYVRATAQDPFGFTERLSFSDYDLHREDISDFPGKFGADRQVFRATVEKGAATDAFGFIAGAERNQTRADLNGDPTTDLSDTSLFGVVRDRVLEPLTLTGALRYDDPSRYAARVTGRVSAAWAVGAGVVITGSAGSGYKIPTISEAVCDFCFTAPVPLRPERAEGYDVRLGWTSADGRVTAALTGYQMNIRDQIAYVDGRYVNIARTRSTGLEAEADVLLVKGLSLKLGLADERAVDADTGARLIRIPRVSGSASLFWDDGPWTAALSVRTESSELDTDVDGFSIVTRPGFTVADLSGAYRLTGRITLTARVQNLADKRYQQSFGYGEPGRTAFVGLKFAN